MIQKSDGSVRRILTYPAVHPCEAISPATLLTSLISLTHNICSFKSKVIATNSRNARRTIRQIAVVRFFLEEVRDGSSSSGLPSSTVLSLSELHLTFQKVEFLLEDLARDDARVWMLMNSERVANQFRVLSRDMATALDVLPLGSVDAAAEVKEHVELVTRQARKAGFEVDPDDIRVVEAVRSILTGFEKLVRPGENDLKRVMEYLGIRKWSKCEKQVKFLDSEIGLENLGAQKKKVGVLSSLKGMMGYCRVVLFGVVDSESVRRSETKCSGGGGGEVLKLLNLEDFRCPISLEMMVDPVTIGTGHSYDRVSITKWFKAGNATCPKTGEKVKSTEVVPNLALKRLINQHCVENGVTLADSDSRNRTSRVAVAGSLAAEGAMKLAGKYLNERLEVGAGEEQNKAAYETRLLSKTIVFNRSCLVEAGVTRGLLKLLNSTDSVTQENAMAAVLNLSKYPKSRALIVENGGLDLVVDVLRNGLKLEACQHAAGTLFYLASVEEYRIMIGENSEAIPGLKELIKDGGTDRAMKNALVAIFGLLTHPANHRRVIAAGVVPLLVNISTCFDSEVLVTDALAILATLAEKPDGSVAILRCNALDSIVGVLNCSSIPRAGKEFCVSLLLALCANGGRDVVALLVKSPSVMGSLYSQLSEGTSRASKKASSLIRVLHEFHERRSSGGSIPPVLPQEQRFVHVR